MLTGASLKKLTTTLAYFSKELITWLPVNFIVDFGLKENFSSVFQSLLSDVLATHITQQMEVISKVCFEFDAEANDTFEIHFGKMLAIIDKWFLKEIQSRY